MTNTTKRLWLIPLTCVLLFACKQHTEQPTTGAAPEQPAPQPKPALKFGVLPAVDKAVIAKSYAPLISEMSVALSREVELVIADDYDTLLMQMLNETIHFGQMSAYVYVKGASARLLGGVETHVLAQQRLAVSKAHRGVIVVPGGSKISKLEELKGKRFAFVDEGSSSGFYYPRMLMRSQGIDPETFFAQTLFAGSHDRVIEAIRSDQADGGAISAQALPRAHGFKELARTDAIPDDAIVSLGGLTPEERQKITALFLSAHENPRMSRFMGARGIEKYVTADVSVYLEQEKEMTEASAAQMERDLGLNSGE